MQKRLILVRLNELYIEFKKVHPDLKIGFSKFCEFRPKWCQNVTSSGMHSVCVCSYHQNVILACSAIPVKCDYKQLMDVCVCDLSSRDCMLHLYDECPPKEDLASTIRRYFLDNEYSENDVISYKQWVSTDRTTLLTIQTTLSEYIDTVTDMIYDLSHHHFIKEAQSKYLKDSKENLDETVIILMDFAENYALILQDCIQGFYWQNDQATLHPFAVYHRDFDSNELKCDCYCVISDYLKHNQNVVHCFLKSIYIRESLVGLATH